MKRKLTWRNRMKQNRVCILGWVLAAVLLALWMGKPRVKIVEKTEWKVKRVVETRIVTNTRVVAAKGAVGKVDKDGNVTITGGFTLDTTRAETGKDATISEGHTEKTTTPATWTGRIGASLLVPPPFKIQEYRTQLEMDWNVGSLFGLDVGMGGRIIFPATWVPEFYGIAVSITF